MTEWDFKKEIFLLILWGIVQFFYLEYPCPRKLFPLIPCLYHLGKSVHLGINFYKERKSRNKKENN